MYRLDREDFIHKKYVALWSVLGFQAGFINVFGFLSCGRYVSHVTGFGAQIGIALAKQNPLFAIELLGIPLSFIFGSLSNSILTIARIERGLKPRFDLITAFLPFLLMLMTLTGQNGFFGIFGEPLVEARDFVLLFTLSFFCGMQNGCFAVLTKGQIRTTHLTGIATDIGTDLGRTYFGKLLKNERALTRKVNFSRVSTFVCFTIGSIFSALFCQKAQYSALIIPLITSIFIYFSIKKIGNEIDKKI